MAPLLGALHGLSKPFLCLAPVLLQGGGSGHQRQRVQWPPRHVGGEVRDANANLKS